MFRHIMADVMRCSPQCPNGFFQFVFPPAHEHDGRARSHETLRHAEANAGGATGNDGHFMVQTEWQTR